MFPLWISDWYNLVTSRIELYRFGTVVESRAVTISWHSRIPDCTYWCDFRNKVFACATEGKSCERLKGAVAGGAIVLDHRSRGAQKGIMACIVRQQASR